MVYLYLRGQREPTAKHKVNQAAKQPLRHRRHRLPRLLRGLRRRGRGLGRTLPRALRILVLVAVLIVLDNELRLRTRILNRRPTRARAAAAALGHGDALPEHLALELARLALDLEDRGEDALQDADAVQDLLRGVALRGRAGARTVERGRERGDGRGGRRGEGVVRDEVEEARGDDADERRDVLRGFVEGAADCGCRGW